MPTFGYTVAGGFSAALTADVKRATAFALPEAGVVSKLSVYVEGGGFSQVIRGAIYTDVAGQPGPRQGPVSSEVTVGVAAAAGWVDLAIPGGVTLAAGIYWLALHSGATGAQANVYYDTQQARMRVNDDAYSDGPSDPWGDATFADRKMCIYATYTPADVESPTVAITSPSEGDVVSGSVSVQATAGDEVAVVGVQFLLDGANLGSEDTAAPYAVTWNTTAVADGSHVLSAVTRDAAGNTGTAEPVTVSVSNVSDAEAPSAAIEIVGQVLA